MVQPHCLQDTACADSGSELWWHHLQIRLSARPDAVSTAKVKVLQHDDVMCAMGSTTELVY